LKIVAAFFRLIRWPNLVFILITQLLFYWCISKRTFTKYQVFSYLQPIHLLLIIAASVFIAAAGYIINDYFDLNIDRVNKPHKLVVEKIIKRRWAIVWHLVLSAIGLCLSFCASLLIGDWYFIITIANFCCIVALWVYSTTYKRRLLIGNTLISALTAWVILVLYIAEFPHWFKVDAGYLQAYNYSMEKLFKYAVLYAAFAFVISLIREVIKDMEDMEGDAKYGCKTMPIVWGIPTTKVFVAVWIVVLLGALTILQFYVLHFNRWMVGLFYLIYSLAFIILPLAWILRRLYLAKVANDYHKISTIVKLVMFAGILSMIFFEI
jgi:4-hydroxybenzoate polyprenyltransferase